MAKRTPGLVFTKAHGTGNSFLICDLRTSSAAKSLLRFLRDRGLSRSDLVKWACSAQFGVGADGFLFLEKSKAKRADVAWDFYNADGSKAEMCGNASRCVGLFLASNRFPQAFSLSTRAGVVGLEARSPEEIRVKMPRIKKHQALKLKLGPSERRLFSANAVFVDSGVPHVVVFCNELAKVSGKAVSMLSELTARVRGLSQFRKSGTNVTFVSTPHSTGGQIAVHSLTFERGVSGFTLACGTGAVAAAAATLAGHMGYVQVHVPGGELSVEITKDHPMLCGPAQIVGEIRIR